MYKLFKYLDDVVGAYIEDENGHQTVFNFKYPPNNDYANFKREINDETAQLQDADGNLMSAQQAKAYVATLP